MRRRAAWLALVALLGPLAAPVPAASPGAGDGSGAEGGAPTAVLTVLDEVPFDEAAHAAWRLWLPAGGVLRVEAVGSPLGARAVGFLLGAEAPRSGGGSGAGARVTMGATQVHVSSDALGVPVGSSPVGMFGVAAAGGSLSSWMQTGGAWSEDTWHAVAITAADGAWQGQLRLLASPGAVLQARRTGPAFMDTEPDFRGERNVLLAAGGTVVLGGAVPGFTAPGAGALVREMRNVEVRREVQGHFYGFFEGTTNFRLAMEHATPLGTGPGTRFFWKAPPGAYTFRVLDNFDVFPCYRIDFGIVAPCTQAPRLGVFGADVILP